MRHIRFRLALLLAGMAPALKAQGPMHMAGERVRLEHTPCDRRPERATCESPRRVDGTVIRWGPDTLMLLVDSGTWALSVRDITRFERHSGHRTAALEGAVSGAVGGTVVGGVIALLFGPSREAGTACSFWSWSESNSCGPENFLAASMGVGVTAGLLIGGLIGSQIRVDRWEELPLPAGARPTAVGSPQGLGLGLSVLF